MKEDKRPKIDPETGLQERTVNIAAILKMGDLASWAKPRGTDLFGRVKPAIDYLYSQEKNEIWLYNRKMLTGP